MKNSIIIILLSFVVLFAQSATVINNQLDSTLEKSNKMNKEQTGGFVIKSSPIVDTNKKEILNYRVDFHRSLVRGRYVSLDRYVHDIQSYDDKLDSMQNQINKLAVITSNQVNVSFSLKQIIDVVTQIGELITLLLGIAGAIAGTLHIKGRFTNNKKPQQPTTPT